MGLLFTPRRPEKQGAVGGVWGVLRQRCSEFSLPGVRSRHSADSWQNLRQSLALPLCALASICEKWENKNLYIIGLLWGLNEFIDIKHLE